MKRGPSSQDIRWIVAGVVIVGLLVLLFIRFHPDPAQQLSFKALSLSLGEERKAMLLCLEPLDALKQAILDEPIAGVSYGRLPTR